MAGFLRMRSVFFINISLRDRKKTDMHPIDLIRGSSMQVRQNLTGVPEPDIQDAKISPEGTGKIRVFK